METAELLMLVGDFMVALGLAILCFLLFVWFVSRRIEAHISQQLNEVIEDLAQNRLIPLRVEKYGDQFLCYHSVTSDFVCQGADLSEIIEKFKARYPEKSASIYNGDELAVKDLRQQLDELRKTSPTS
jgi:hypothetical protein